MSPYWYAWAVLVPGMVWMARRFRFERHTWRRAAAAHLPGVLLFTCLHAFLTVPLRMPIMEASLQRRLSK